MEEEEEEEKHSADGEKKGRGWLRARRVFNQSGPSDQRSFPGSMSLQSFRARRARTRA
jgi:hypothetical protein